MKFRRIAPQTDATPASESVAMVDARYRAVYQAVLREKSSSARHLAIRSAAGIPLAGKRQIRNAIDCADQSGGHQSQKSQTRCCTLRGCTDGLGQLPPLWRKSLKTLEGMYGSGVLSFFVFMKSLFTLNIILTLLMMLFVIAPQSISWGQQSAMVTGLQSSPSTNVSGYCSQKYAANLSSSVDRSTTVTKLLDIIQGTGMLENTILFIGYYFPTEITIGRIAYKIPVAYLSVVGVSFLVSLLFMLNRTGVAFKEVLVQAASTAAADAKFSTLALSAWDHGLASSDTAGLAKQILRNNFTAELDLHQLLLRQRAGDCGLGCRRLAKRILANLAVLASLAGAGYLIYRVQTLSAEFTSDGAAAQSGSLAYFAYQYLPSVVVSLVSGILPAAFHLLVQLEEYTPDTALAVTLGRCIFLRLASLAVLVASIYATVTCQAKDVCGVGVGPACTAVTCWESYVGQAFYKLEVTFLAVHLLVCFLVELPRSLIGRKCRCGLAKLIGPPEFDIADSVLQVLYSQVLVWFGMLFCPFLPAMNAVALFVLFYLKKFSCHFSYQPPQRPLKNSSATALFMATLFMAYFLCVIPIGYLIVALPTSKSCSPFRTGDVAYQSISGLVSTFGSDARNLLGYLGSAGFLFVVAVALLMAIHYYRTLAIAKREIGDQLLKQLTEQEQQKFSRIGSDGPTGPAALSHLSDRKPRDEARDGEATTPV